MGDSTSSTEESFADPTSWPAAWCLHCGYDLRGLVLPRPCPECGRVADPAREREAVRAFMTGWKSWFWFLMPSRKIPAGILYLLDDPDSRRMAKRRAFLCWWLPAILGTALVLIGQQIVVERTMTRHYYRQNDPAKKIILERHYDEENRPFCFNLHLHGLFQAEPIGCSYNVTYDIGRIRFMNPIDFDPFSLIFIGPIWVALAGMMFVFVVLKWRGRRSDRMATFLPIANSIRAVSRCLLPSLSMAFWLWFVLLVCALVYEMRGGRMLETVGTWVAWMAAGWLALIVLVALPRMVMLDKARRLFASPLIGALLLWVGFACGVGMVTFVFWGITILCEMLAYAML